MSRWNARNQGRTFTFFRLRRCALNVAPLTGAGVMGGSVSDMLPSGITLFPPRISVIVVAPCLPVTGFIMLREADAREPLGALPEIEIRRDGTNRGTVC